MNVVKESKNVKAEQRIPVKTNLTWYEVSVAIHLVGLRHTESLRKGMQDKHGYKGRDMQDNLYGMLGEIAFAKITNKYFPMTVNTFKEADIGVNWQVRTVGSNKNTSLIVRYADPDEHKYALMYIKKVEGVYEATFKGWIKGKDAKQARFLTDFGYSNRPKVFRVPNAELQTPNYFPL